MRRSALGRRGLGVTCALLGLATAPRGGFAQEPLALVRLQAPIRLDGRPDEPVWRQVPPLPLAKFEPDPGGRPSERSVIRVAYDGEYLYAAGEFGDADPGGIRTNSMVRDYYAGDDLFNLVIDTFDDHESAVWFVATPNGTRVDGAISHDAQGPESQWNHPEYNMVWDAAAVIHQGGWSVELRIPLATLRFQVREGRVRMGLIAARLIARKKERHIYPGIRPTVAAAQFKPSLAARVLLDGITPRPLLQVTPYLLSGVTARSAGAPGASGREQQVRGEAGVDVKYGLSSRFTLDLTANTDFAQTEVDDQQVNLTRFSLFFPEKRQFFLERGGLFDFTTGGADRVFYSRRIGLGAEGVPLRILGGGRLVGRAGKWDLGLLDLQTAGATDRPGSNAGVFRLRRSIVNANSYVGGIATVSGASWPRASQAVGLDAAILVGGRDRFTGAIALSHDPSVPAGVFERSVARLLWSHDRRDGLSLQAGVSRIGTHYAPGLGYVQRAGVVASEQAVKYGWFPGRGRFREHAVAVAATGVVAIRSGVLETMSVEGSWTGTWQRGGEARIAARMRREVLRVPFALSPAASVPAGGYSFPEVGVSVATAPGARARIRAELQGGGFFDGRRLSWSVTPTWNPSAQLELSGQFEANRISLPGRDQRFAGDLMRLRARVAANPRLSLGAIVQYNRAAGTLNGQVRLRYNVREGTDLHAVLNEAWEDAERTMARLPGARTAGDFTLKYSHTFR